MSLQQGAKTLGWWWLATICNWFLAALLGVCGPRVFVMVRCASKEAGEAVGLQEASAVLCDHT